MDDSRVVTRRNKSLGFDDCPQKQLLTKEASMLNSTSCSHYSPTVDPSNRPLALDCLGHIGQEFQVGVPWCSCQRREKSPVNEAVGWGGGGGLSYIGALCFFLSDEERDEWLLGQREVEEVILLTGWTRGGSLRYIVFQHLTIVWLSRRWRNYLVTQRQCSCWSTLAFQQFGVCGGGAHQFNGEVQFVSWHIPLSHTEQRLQAHSKTTWKVHDHQRRAQSVALLSSALGKTN